MKCKYDENHGDFPNPVKLRHHYDEAHAGEYVAKDNANAWSKVQGQCSACGTRMAQGGFGNSHRVRFHNGDASVTFIPDRIGVSPVSRPTGVLHGNMSGFCRRCGGPCKRKNIPRHMLDVHGIVVETGRPDLYWSREPVEAQVPAVAPTSAPVSQRQPQTHTAGDPVELAHAVTVDDIVIPVIEGIAAPGRMVPVAHLAALFAWRDATAAMLRAVQD